MSDERLKFWQKNVRQWNEEEKEADNAAVCVAICSGCIERKMTKFLFLWQPNLRVLNALT